MAALVRHGAANALTNTEPLPQSPKTFGIPLHTCVMSRSHQVDRLMYFELSDYFYQYGTLLDLAVGPVLLMASGRVTS